MSLPSRRFGAARWREGTNAVPLSRFAAARVRPAHRDHRRAEPDAAPWLLVEWPKGEAEPAIYRLSTLPITTTLTALAGMAKIRSRIECDFQDLKPENGLAHREGRFRRGLRHYASLSIAACGFLVSEWETIPPHERVPPKTSERGDFPWAAGPAALLLRTGLHIPDQIATLRIRLSVAVARRPGHRAINRDRPTA